MFRACSKIRRHGPSVRRSMNGSEPRQCRAGSEKLLLLLLTRRTAARHYKITVVDKVKGNLF